MDPYLEQFWGDVNSSLVIYVRNQLQQRLPNDLRARVQERVFVESPTSADRTMYPDIRVVERPRKHRDRAATALAVDVAEPLRMRLPDEPVTQGYIEIIDLGSGRRVVTVIEVLSPSNKAAGPGRRLYAKKQQECRAGGVGLVEIDLLRGGSWVLSVAEHVVPASHRLAYRVCVRRPGPDGIVDVYRVPLRERLPVIGIPLRPTDADVPLDLNQLIEQCYCDGGYDDDIDYRAEPDPPLCPDDARWADALLRQQGHRPAKQRTARTPRPRKRNGSG
jgi:hypothetical protein